MNTKHIHKHKGFTLLEILLVVAAIGILAAIVIVAVSPQRQLAKVRNSERQSEITALSDAIYQYNIDNNGTWPENSTLTNNKGTRYAVGTGTCSPGDTNYTGSASSSLNLSDDLTTTYLSSLPVDPQSEVSGCTGYEIELTNNDRIKVYAPRAENGKTISIKR